MDDLLCVRGGERFCDRDRHTIISLALGTGLRLAQIIGLNVSDVFAPDDTPRIRVRVRKEIAKGARAAGIEPASTFQIEGLRRLTSDDAVQPAPSYLPYGRQFVAPTQAATHGLE